MIPLLIAVGDHFGILHPSAPQRDSKRDSDPLAISAWSRLDRFEGEMYVREQMQPEMEDRTTLPAGTYIVRFKFLCYLDTSEWSFA